MDRILDLIRDEEKRQKETLMMIPSENYTYPEVRRAVGSVLMHKYAEGDPGRRYYQGNEVADRVESLCEQRVLEAFGIKDNVWSVNVQPHSGCEANLIVYNAVLNPGGKILSMYLPDGGHLSHGWFMGERRLTLVSKIYDVSFYHVDPKTNVFDYGEIEKIAKKTKPGMIITGGTAYTRDIDYGKMARIAKSVGAYFLADIAHEAGLIAGGAMNSPFKGGADFVTFTTHKTLRGPRGAVIVSKKKYGDLIDRSVIPGVQGGPHLHTIAGIAIALEKTKTAAFKKYAKQVITNAKVLASEFEKEGLDVVSGGTDKHLVLIDLRNKKTNGWFVAWALEKAGIVVNRNTVPNDTGSPFYPSGLRLGTPAITVRGMKEAEMKKIAKWIVDVVDHIGNAKVPKDSSERKEVLSKFLTDIEKDKYIKSVAAEVTKLCKKFPIEF